MNLNLLPDADYNNQRNFLLPFFQHLKKILFQVEKNKHDMKTKDFQVKKMEDTVHGLEMKMKEKDIKVKNFQDKV